MKKCFRLLIFFIALSIAHTLAFAQNINLVDKGKSGFKIYIADDTYRNDAAILNSYLKNVSGIQLDVINGLKSSVTNGIIIGQQNKLAKISTANFPVLKNNAVLLKETNNNIFISSNSAKGVTYAIYSFIEQVLGCRYFYENGKYIPSRRNISIPKAYSFLETPVFSHRQYWYFGSFVPSAEYLTWHKLDNYKSDKSWAMFMVHNLDNFVPDVLLNSKPQFFAVNNGVRVKDQLDFSSPELQNFLIEKVKKYFIDNPTATTVALNPKDNENYCQCDLCKRTYEIEQSKMGTLLTLVNAIAKNFPDKQFVLQAFKSNRRPPKNIIPGKNVKIVLSDIEVTRLHDIQTSSNARVMPFIQDLKIWRKKTNNLLIWDYLTWYDNSFIPFPNFDNMAANAKFFASNGVDGIFWEGDGSLPSFQYRLRAYIAAKLLWNPNTNIEVLIKQFCDFYYEDASNLMQSYLKKLNQNKKAGNIEIETGNDSFYSDASKTYLSKSSIAAYRKLLTEAKAMVSRKPEVANRIELDEIGLLIFELEIDRRNRKKDLNKVDQLEKMFAKHKIQKYNYYLRDASDYLKTLKN